MEQLSDSRQMIGGAHPELLPFRVSYIVKRSETLFSEGQVLSNADRCGMFICERGEVEVSFEEQTYVMLHSYLDQQVATDIGIKFHFENALVSPMDGEVGVDG